MSLLYKRHRSRTKQIPTPLGRSPPSRPAGGPRGRPRVVSLRSRENRPMEGKSRPQKRPDRSRIPAVRQGAMPAAGRGTRATAVLLFQDPERRTSARRFPRGPRSSWPAGQPSRLRRRCPARTGLPTADSWPTMPAAPILKQPWDRGCCRMAGVSGVPPATAASSCRPTRWSAHWPAVARPGHHCRRARRRGFRCAGFRPSGGWSLRP